MTNYIRAFYYLHSMMRSAYWNRSRMMEHQGKRLRHMIKYSYDNVPFYHKRFKKLGIVPSSVSSVEDLDKLPILRKEEIRRNPEAFISREYDLGNLRRFSTSGSTGKPLFVYVNQAEDEFRKAKHLRANISCGQKLRDRWVMIGSPRHFGATTRLQRSLGLYVPIGVSVLEDVSSQASVIQRIDPDVLDGYSSSLFLLAKEVERRGLAEIRPRFMISGAELVDNASRQLIERIFNAPLFDQYACIEFDRISWQCPERIGYHMDVDSLILQFCSEDGEVSSGESGEIVCTSLFNHAMPLIRYAIGDIGIQSNDTCSCGRKLPLMKVIEGRSDSLLVFPDGRVLSPRTFAVAISLFKYYSRIDQFRVVQKKIDLFEIHIKLNDENTDRETVRKDLVIYFKRILCLSSDMVTFDVRFVKDIPLDKSGKLMIVVSELSKTSGNVS